VKHLLYLPKSKSFLAFALLVSSLVITGQSPSREYQLKAAVLFNFTQFVEWPATALPTGADPWIIGVLGENPFGTYLEELVSGEKMNGHGVIINYYKRADEIRNCQILFVYPGDRKKQEEVIAGLKNRSILTVSDDPAFPASGGMIRLFTRDNKIRMEVNLEASKAANLVISSKLLRLAEIFTSNN
jgi:hypothetical protein